MTGSRRKSSDTSARPALIPGRWKASFVHAVSPAMDAFLDHLSAGRILGVRCRSCGRVSAQPRVRCPFCHARPGDTMIEVGPAGIIRSACIAVVPMAGLNDTPDAMACVQPDGADSALLVRLHGIETLSGAALTAIVGRGCRLRPPKRPSRTWADLEFEFLGGQS